MKRKKGKKSLFKKIIKLIIVKIKQLAKYILTTAKQTRLRTKIIYVLLALVAFGLFNYRKGELSIPKKVVLFNKVNMNKYNMEIYYMDEDDIEEYTQNYFPSVYRDGIKYYVTGKGHKYRITRNEFLKCVYKKDYSKNVKYKIGALTTGVVLTYESFNDEWEEECEKDVYSQDIMKLLNEKIKKYEDNENKESNYHSDSGRILNSEEEKRRALSLRRKQKVDRVTEAWSDLCFKYRVNASEMMVLYKMDYSNLKIEDDSKIPDRPLYQISDIQRFFGKNYEMEKLPENLNYLSNHVRFDYRLLGIGNFVDMEDIIGYVTMTGLNRQSRFRSKIKKRFIEKMEVANSTDIYKAATYLNNADLPNLPYYTKTFTRGKDVLQICIDNVNDIAVVVVFNTDDVITKKALSMEMDSIMLNSLKKKIWVNWYIVVRMILFMIIEWLVFVYIGKRSKEKLNKSLNCLQYL